METQNGGHHTFNGHQKVKVTITLGSKKADKPTKMAPEGSTWGDLGLVQNLEIPHEVCPKLFSVCTEVSSI